MSNHDDRELRQWGEDWRAEPPEHDPAETLRLYAQGRGRFMWTWVLTEFAIGGIALPVVAYLGWQAPGIIERVAMALLALITVAAVGVGWWNWRGSVVASARTTTEFVVASAERLRRMRQAWRIGWGVLAAQVAVFSVWIWDRTSAGDGSAGFAWTWLAIVTAAAVLFLLWTGRWIRRDVEKFEALKAEWEK